MLNIKKIKKKISQIMINNKNLKVIMKKKEFIQINN